MCTNKQLAHSKIPNKRITKNPNPYLVPLLQSLHSSTAAIPISTHVRSKAEQAQGLRMSRLGPGLLASSLLAAWLFVFFPAAPALSPAGRSALPEAIDPSFSSSPSPSKSSWTISETLPPTLTSDPKPHPNLLFLLPPKVGGTTISVILQRVAGTWNKVIAKQPARMGHFMCSSDSGTAKSFWKHLIAKNNALEIVFGPMCFQSFIVNQPDQWQGGRKPLVIGLVRDAWARWESAWRFLKKRCEEKDPKMPREVANQCAVTVSPYGLEAYTMNECVNGFLGSCSEQHHWLAPYSQAPPEILLGEYYDFIMVLERFDESLAVLHFDYGFPASSLPYVRVNANSKTPPVHVSYSIKKKALNHGLKKDVQTHATALKYLSARIAQLNVSLNGERDSFLRRLHHANALAVKNCAATKEQIFTLDNFDESFKVSQAMRNSLVECLDKQWLLTFRE